MSSLLHEVSTPVTYIKGNIEFLQKIISDMFLYLEKNSLLHNDDIISEQKYSDIKKYAEKVILTMNTGVEKAFDIITIYRDYLRKNKEEINDFDVASLIDNSLELILSTISPSIKIEKQYTTTAVIRVNKSKFAQIIVNLVLNAIQSINDTGTVFIIINTDDKNVYVSIKDNGKGISKQNMEKIFTPFFTTKDEGNMGLGLFISSLIIEEYGGKIDVESEEKVGSIFKISLPLCKKK